MPVKINYNNEGGAIGCKICTLWGLNTCLKFKQHQEEGAGLFEFYINI